MKTLIRTAFARPTTTGAILILLSGCLFTWAAAIKEGYVTRSLTVATNTAEVFFPQNPTKSVRLVSYDVNGDTNTAILTLYSGTMPLTITGIINVTNLVVTANTNVQTNALVMIQRADDTIFSLTVLFTNQFTNIFISATNSIPVLTNDVLWVCTNSAWTIIGSNTVRLRRKPVRHATTCAIQFTCQHVRHDIKPSQLRH